MTGGSVLQVVTLTEPTIEVGDIRAILRSTVATVEGDLGRIGTISPRRKLAIALSLLDTVDEKRRYTSLTAQLSEALSNLQVDERHWRKIAEHLGRWSSGRK